MRLRARWSDDASLARATGDQPDHEAQEHKWTSVARRLLALPPRRPRPHPARQQTARRRYRAAQSRFAPYLMPGAARRQLCRGCTCVVAEPRRVLWQDSYYRHKIVADHPVNNQTNIASYSLHVGATRWFCPLRSNRIVPISRADHALSGKASTMPNGRTQCELTPSTSSPLSATSPRFLRAVRARAHWAERGTCTTDTPIRL